MRGLEGSRGEDFSTCKREGDVKKTKKQKRESEGSGGARRVTVVKVVITSNLQLLLKML